MTKQEFLNELRGALAEMRDPAGINEQLVFYDKYIEDEMAKGRSMDDIVAELGGAKLVANSILQAGGYRDLSQGGKTYTAYDTPDGDPTTFAQGREYRGNANDTGQYEAGPDAQQNASGTGRQKNRSAGQKLKGIFAPGKVRGCIITLIVILILFLILRGVFSLIGGILSLFLAPFIGGM